MKTILATLIVPSLVALAMVGLGLYALIQFFLTWRIVHLAQSVVPLYLGGWWVWVLAKAWLYILLGNEKIRDN
ncbi:hypothetical protein [Methylomagnum sp.]